MTRNETKVLLALMCQLHCLVASIEDALKDELEVA